MVGLAVTSASLASRKSSHALCAFPTAWKSLSFLIDFSLKGINLMQKKCHVKTAVLVKSCSIYFFMGAGVESFPAWPGCQGQCIGSRGRLDNSHPETQTRTPGFCVSSPGTCPDNAVWADHTSQGLCEIQQAAPGVDAAGLASASKGEPDLWFYTTFTLLSRGPLGTSDTLNTSLLQPKLPIL